MSRSSALDSTSWKSAFGENACVDIGAKLDEQLPFDTRQFLRDFGFPLVVIFDGERPFELRFNKLRLPICQFNDLIEEPEAIWDGQLAIGEFEACSIRWDICLDRMSGAVTHIDVEASIDVGTVNSSMRHFGESVLAVMRCYSDCGRDIERCMNLPDVLADIDSEAYNGHRSFWRSLAIELADDESGFTLVTCDTRCSKPRF